MVAPVTVVGKNVSFQVKTATLGERCCPWVYTHTRATVGPTGLPIEGNAIQLLSGVTFMAKPNELTTIIGPSGCGKTTLLNVICQRTRGTISGSVLFNGKESSRNDLGRMLTICYATDKLLPYLTLRETLMFAALLRMKASTKQDREDRVNTILSELSLMTAADTYVGGMWSKGLSTGETRRASIAVELIAEPSVLLLDEPTSGLDAVLAFEIMFILKQLALKGRTIICTLHQPRSSIVGLTNNFVVMSGGRVLFSGAPEKIRPFFVEEVNLPIDESRNLAEFLIDLASGVADSGLTLDDANAKPSSRRPEQGREIAATFEKSKAMSELATNIEASLEASHDPNDGAHPKTGNSNWWFTEVIAVMTRTFKSNIRNYLAFGIVLIIQILMGLFLGGIFFKLPMKFLPDNQPIEISDDSSPVMALFHTPVATLFTSGIDGKGSNPLFQMLIDGVDGNGSVPFDAFAEYGLASDFQQMPACTHRALALEDLPIYASTDFSEFDHLWPVDDESQWGPHEWASDIMRILQFTDYALRGPAPWADLYPWVNESITDVVPLSGLYPCHTVVNELLVAMSVCSGVFPPPPGAHEELAAGQACSPAFRKWLDTVERFPSAQPNRAALPTLASSVPSKNRRSSRGRPESTDENTLKQQEELSRRRVIDFAADAENRRLQAASLISGGLVDMISFLPQVALDAIDKIEVYREAILSCGHVFCQELRRLSETDDGATKIVDYAMVLAAVLNISGAVFFSVANIGFAAYDALVTFPQERVIFNREVANEMYRPSSYFIGKSLGDIFFQFAPIVGLTLGFYFMVGLYMDQPAASFWIFISVCLLISFTSYGYSYAVSAASPTMEVAVIAAPMILVILMACSGFFVRDTAVPDWLVWVKYLSLYRWGFFALLLNQFPPGKSFWGLPNSFSLALAGISETRLWVCIIWLAGLAIGSRILAYIFLRFAHRRVGIEQ